MKKIFITLALILLSAGSATCSAGIIQITTSCGEIAWIDSNRGTPEQFWEQVALIEETLCPDSEEEEEDQPERPEKP